MNNNTVEVELRAKVDISIYQSFVDKDPIDLNEHDSYFTYTNNTQKNWIARIRQRNTSFFLTFKSKKQFGEGAWSEVDIEISQENALNMKQFFLANDFYLDVEIKKIRKSYLVDDMEVNIDDIEGLGLFIETEIKTDSQHIEAARQKLLSYFRKLAIPSEDIFSDGYVKLMRNKNER